MTGKMLARPPMSRLAQYGFGGRLAMIVFKKHTQSI